MTKGEWYKQILEHLETLTFRSSLFLQRKKVEENYFALFVLNQLSVTNKDSHIKTDKLFDDLRLGDYTINMTYA